MTANPKNGPGRKVITTNGVPVEPQATAGQALTLSGDDVVLSAPAALFVGTGGHVKVDFQNGTNKHGVAVSAFKAVLLKNIASGSFLPVLVTTVYATDNGTTAADIVALHSEAASIVVP